MSLNNSTYAIKNIFDQQVEKILSDELSVYFYSDNFGIKSNEILKIVEIDMRRAMRQVLSALYPDIYKRVESIYEDESLTKDEQHAKVVKKIKYEILVNDESAFSELMKNLEREYRRAIFEYVSQKYFPIMVLAYKKDGIIIIHKGIKNDSPRLFRPYEFRETPVYKYIRVSNNEYIYYSPHDLPTVKGNLKYLSNYIKSVISLYVSPEDYFIKSRTISEYVRNFDVLDKDEIIEIFQNFLGGHPDKFLDDNTLRFVSISDKQEAAVISKIRSYDFHKVYESLFLDVIRLNIQLGE